MKKLPADIPDDEALAHLSSRKDFLKMAGRGLRTRRSSSRLQTATIRLM